MAFQPIINQVEPMLIERGLSNSAQMKANAQVQAAQSIAQGVQQGVSSLSNGVGAAVAMWQKTASQAGKNAGVLAAYDSVNKQAMQNTGKPIIPQEYLDSIAKEKNQDKISGSLMAMAPIVDSAIAQQRQLSYLGAQSNASANLAAFKSTLPDNSPAKPQVITGQNGIYTLDQNGVAKPVVDGSGNPVAPKTSSNPMAWLFGGGTPPAADTGTSGQATQAPVDVIPLPQNQGSAPATQSGGYIPGRKYGGKTFLGGDPNNAASWR